MPKIRVEIIGKAFTRVKKCLVRGNLVVIEKETKDHPEYTAKFTMDSVLPVEKGRIRKRTHRKVMLFEGAKECINFRSNRGQLKGPLSFWDRTAMKGLLDAEIAKKHGQVHTKLDVPVMLYVFLLIIMGLTLVGVLMNSGRIQVV